MLPGGIVSSPEENTAIALLRQSVNIAKLLPDTLLVRTTVLGPNLGRAVFQAVPQGRDAHPSA